METSVVTIIRFWENHHLLDLTQRPVWRVVSGRSRTYVDAICAGAVPLPRCLQGCVMALPYVQGALVFCTPPPSRTAVGLGNSWQILISAGLLRAASAYCWNYALMTSPLVQVSEATFCMSTLCTFAS